MYSDQTAHARLAAGMQTCTSHTSHRRACAARHWSDGVEHAWRHGSRVSAANSLISSSYQARNGASDGGSGLRRRTLLVYAERGTKRSHPSMRAALGAWLACI